MDDLYARLDDYLDDALPPSERAALDAQLAADPALASALAQLREARQRLGQTWANEAEETALRDTLRSTAKDYFKAQPARPRRHRHPRLLPIAPCSASCARLRRAAAAAAAAAALRRAAAAAALLPLPQNNYLINCSAHAAAQPAN